MEDYLRGVRSRLRAGESEGHSIHVVLGGPEVDVDTVASTLSLALHLSQKESSNRLCVPVLFIPRCEAALPLETTTYLDRLNISESSLLWREDVDFLRLHRSGKLSVTLLRDGLLDSPECGVLASSIHRVVHRHGQRDAGHDETASSAAVAVVAGEVLQEATVHVGAALGEALREALQLQSEGLWIQHGRRSAHLDQLMTMLEERRDVAAVRRHDEAALRGTDSPAAVHQQLSRELKDFSDGEMTIALAATSLEVEDWYGYEDEFKSFCRHNNYESLMVVSVAAHPPHQQVVVYSSSTDMLNQICCELEESPCWSHSGLLEAVECSQGCLQVYNITTSTISSSDTPTPLEEGLQSLLKAFVDRRSSVLACQPSSRTSSTEGVAGSVEFSQGSSGITEMYGSDTERAEEAYGDVVAMAGETADGEEDSGGGGHGVGGELVSPDSGMATIRSSRSSKESSVFLSDDSPIGEVTAGAAAAAAGPGGIFLRNPSPLGFSSLSPPVPPERRKRHSSRNKSDNLDLFSFDPFHSSNHSLPTEGSLPHSGRTEDASRAGNDSLSEFEELSMVDFSAPNYLAELEGAPASDDHQTCSVAEHEMIDTMVPPTQVSSSSLSSCGVSFFQEDVAEGIKSLQHKESISSSLSEIWEEFGFDSRGDAAHVIEAGGSKGSENILEGGGVQGSRENEGEGEKQESGIPRLIPQLSLITEFIETDHNWNVDSELRQPLDSLTLADLQLTPPDEDVGIKGTSTIIEAQEEKPFMPRKKELLNTLTPDSSKEEDDGLQGRKGDRQMELLDFWTYSAQQGFMKSESETSASYPESLDMWNMTIRDDSISPLTTPEIDNLSEGSDSLCRRISSIGGEGLLESPLGYSNGGMEMWNTTIQEDSSSTVSPEATEIGRDDGSPQDVSTDALVTPTSQQVEEEKEEDQERWTNRVVQAASVKIVVQGLDRDDDPESNVQENTDEQNMTSDKLKNLTSSNQDLDGWAMPVPRMVTSTSEYDNVAESWSSPSSPDTHSSPVVDMIQLDGQSSPFVTLVKPMAADKVIESKSPRNIQHEAVSGSEESQSQVFQFEGGDELDRISGSGVRIRREYDNKEMEWSYSEPIWTDESNECSPFILVNGSTLSTTLPSVHLSSGDISVTQAHIPQSFSLNQVNLENLETTAENPIEDNKNPLIASSRNVEGGVMETMSLSSSSEGERDEQKYSLDSLHLCSRDDLRSNSDGDSSSCLEMESIIISGTVKEREQDGRDGFQLRQAEESGRCMETYSMLSYAATLLQTQPQESTKQIRRNKLVTDIDTPLSSENESRVLSFQTTSHGSSQCVPTDQPDSEGHKRNTMSSLQSPDKSTTDMFSATQSAMGSRHCQTSIDKTSQHYIVPEIIGPHMTKIDTDIYVQSDSPTTMGSKPQVEEGNSEAQSSIVVRSVSAPLRGPSDNFLKTREEVYVHSQISMEDSDEGGQSPSDPSFCHRFLGGFQGWRDQPVEYHTAPTASAPQSPEFTNSSVSHNSSFIGTPVSESGNAAERVVGLPFSGDLMEDLDDEEEEVDVGEEEAGECFDVTLQPISDPSQIEAAYSSEQSIRSHGIEELSANQATGGSPGDSSVLSWSPTTVNGNSSPSSLTRRHQEMTSQPTYESSPCPWAEDPRSAYYQTQFGYNYHRTDQRIESQSHRQDNLDTRPESPADLTPEIRGADDDEEPEQYESTLSYRNEYTESYGTEENPGYTTQHQREKKDAEEMCGSDQAEGWGQRYEPDHTCRQFDGQTAYQARSEDHAQYVPEGYTHFLLTRAALPGDHAAEAKMMMRTAASMEEGVDEGENREDPPSLDLSGGSNHRKRLAAPPMDVSLDRSEGSLLSDDGLETGDEALDTGDDLDINIDELDTPDETDSLEIDRLGGCEASNQEAGAGASGAIPESRMAEERRDSRLWRSVVIGEQEHRIDMKCIEPYMRVVSHGGYYGDQNAIIVFAACFLPDSNCENYNYVMENLFLYVISTLELMVAEDYMIIYLNGATPRRRMPGFSWMKKCYQMIDRRLKKNLKLFIIVHPSWFIRTVLGLTRPFISSKFSSKIKYVHSLAELRGMIPMEYVHIPPSIVKYEEEMGIHKFACMRLDEELQETAAKDKKWGNSVV